MTLWHGAPNVLIRPCLLVKVNRLDLWMTSDKGLVAFSIVLTTNSVNLDLPMFAASLRLWAISGSMTSPVSKVISSGPVSLNAFLTFLH